MLTIAIETTGWLGIDLESLAERAVAMTLAHLELPQKDVETSLLGCDDARMCQLNSDFRNKSVATNVLSWPSVDLSATVEGTQPQPAEPDFEGVIDLGDIAIAYETCAGEAGDLGKSLEAHATHLIVHGMLHLLGYDHIRDGDATVMQALEIEILGKLGLDDPYMT
ncbi:rRNA maturation RNase YbeY [Roseobacter sp.]|uniref:rRNA maturation RNase YbeY n=1 Tax=Roseobacter sp. TaxID=1907202 RepID=UPI00385FF83C